MPSAVPIIVLIDTLSQSLMGGKGTENIETLQERKTEVFKKSLSVLKTKENASW